jgi:phosphoglycolate phosphatase
MSKIRCVLFDLDGTLVDTAGEIADAVNDTLARWHRAPVEEALIRGWIGDGSRTTLTRAFAHAGLPEPEVARAWPSFEHDYLERCGTRSTVYPGVLRTLQRLSAMGVPMGLVTNKEGAFAHRVLVRHGLSEHFEVIVAGDTLPVQKPDPATVRHCLAALGAEPAHAVLVGDSATDMRTARAAGIAAWAVRHGYAREPLAGEAAPDRFIDRLDDIADAAAHGLDERVSIS